MTLILLTLSIPLFWACVNYDSYYVDEGGEGFVLHVSLSVNVQGNNSAATRADVPNGGEEGDGWQFGKDNENRLHNFTVFVLANNLNVNSPDNVEFAGSRYFSDEEVARVDSIIENLKLKDYNVWKDVVTYDFTIPITQYTAREVSAESFRFIVITNYGDLTEQFTTLGQLRNAIPTATWSVGSDGTAERFVMANENDQYYGSGTGSETDPIRLHVTVERMAARIDYNPTGAALTEDGQLYYNIISDTPTASDEPTPPDNASSTPDTLAQLYIDKMAIVNACQKPSYYIKRVASDINGTGLIYLGDETPTPRGIATNVVIDPYSTQKTAANTTNTTLLTNLFGDTRMSNVEQLLNSDSAPVPGQIVTDVSKSVILGYVNENTYAPNMAHSAYTTGMAFKCRFVPLHNYYTAYNSETDELTEGTYTIDETFYMVEPNQADISEADRLYFKNQADAQAYASNTARKHFCKVVEYVGGICYYFAYFRHSNNVAVIHDTMEFGIVRNNIYTFTLTPTTGPGTPTIDPRHPEELKARIYVKKWYLVEHPTILMS
ncbi:MAG: fimbria major subunit [Prevotella sp.]|nr:fimbria major subunit [Prevotella sp.]